ncbi:MAG: hypothetical protein HY876_03620 [Coriobacteriales bacterium]|nr:hypothetical protein [Coriobacteriales bacterium]
MSIRVRFGVASVAARISVASLLVACVVFTGCVPKEQFRVPGGDESPAAAARILLGEAKQRGSVRLPQEPLEIRVMALGTPDHGLSSDARVWESARTIGDVVESERPTSRYEVFVFQNGKPAGSYRIERHGASWRLTSPIRRLVRTQTRSAFLEAVRGQPLSLANVQVRRDIELTVFRYADRSESVVVTPPGDILIHEGPDLKMYWGEIYSGEEALRHVKRFVGR